MQIRALLDLEQFPDSLYANELRRATNIKGPDLRFSPVLEKDFQAFQLERARAHVRFFQLASCLLCLAIAAHLIFLDGAPVRDVLFGWLGLAIPATLFLMWASWCRFYDRWNVPVGRVALPVLGIASAVGVAVRVIA